MDTTLNTLFAIMIPICWFIALSCLFVGLLLLGEFISNALKIKHPLGRLLVGAALALSFAMSLGLLFLESSAAFAKEVDCSRHKIFCQIVENRPNINRSYAMHLSNIIYKFTRKYKVDARIYTAILAQENMYRLTKNNCTTGLLPTGEKATVCSDFGISQIHYRTAERYNFDIERLDTDLQYSVEAGVKVLADFKKMYSKKEKDYWTRYNSSNRTYREVYRNLVSRYF